MKEFNQKEKETISKQLYEKGKEAFSRYGIKKTSIEELTKAVGIAKGSFYSFYRSKEDLYFKILLDEVSKATEFNKATIVNKAGNTGQQPEARQILKIMLHSSVNEMDQNPILNKMLNHEEYEQVYRKISTHDTDTYALDIIEPLSTLLSKWQGEGKVIAEDPKLLASVVKCLYLLTTHKKELSEDYFGKVIDFMIDMISEKFTRIEVDQK